MFVARVVVSGSRRESWTVVGDDGVPIEPVERYLAFLTDIERSPNTVKAYAHDLKDWFVESTFSTVRHRTKVTKGPGSRAAGLAMAFKLIEAAQLRWRAVNAPHLVALVRAGARFHHGQLVERSDEAAA